MDSSDEIRSILKAELEQAMARHDSKKLYCNDTGVAVARAIERYRQFATRGIIPEDIAEDRKLVGSRKG